MRRRHFVLALALGAACAPAASAEAGIMAESAWAPPSLAGARNGVAYFTLMNHGGAPDQLVGASTPVAEKAELHRDEMQDGVMRMRPAGPLPLAPGAMETLEPGGLHLMLMGLKQPLKPGERFPITLRFAHQPPLTVETTVRAAAPAGHAHH
jgi:copper(I)-binding protein